MIAIEHLAQQLIDARAKATVAEAQAYAAKREAIAAEEAFCGAFWHGERKECLLIGNHVLFNASEEPWELPDGQRIRILEIHK